MNKLVGSEVVMLSAHGDKRKTSLIELQEQLQQLPGLIADVESTTANLTHLETSFEEVENHLLNLEDLCEQCELERYKHMQSQQLENYKKNKSWRVAR
ncbi:dysbindin-like isoform 2-T3 [Molossus nigricans]